MAEIAGSVVSAVFSVLFEKMASKEVVDFFKQRKLNDEMLRKLKRRINAVSGLLEDAEEKQITTPAVRNWLDDLKDVAYDADDLLDEIAYKAREKQHLEAGPKTCLDQVRNFFSSLNPRKKGIGELQPELEKILARMEDLLQQKDFLNLEKSDGSKPSLPSSLQSQQGRLTTSLVDESGIYGRDGDKKAIVELLLSDDAGSICPGVVSVVGMGGIGKTTLAQLVFNDSRVKGRFDKLKVWVCVSEERDVIKLTKNILKEIGSSNCDSMTLNQLQLELQEKVKGQRILLVMDDVWNRIDWELFLKPLNSVARGSKILVTTREEKVLSKVKGVSSHQLKVLSEEDSWLLFARHAFDGNSSEAYTDLKELGTKIIRKCKGLPLAVKTIGSVLYSERRSREWEKILESSMWDLDDGIIIPALKLSYHYLPSHLKQCFAYCAMFPKDYQFRKEELSFIWTAEGFIVKKNNDKRELEEIGEKYFEDLLSRSFFQKYEMYKGDYFVMHDLMNDLAKSIAGEFCYNNVEDNSSKLTERTRHLFYTVRDGCNVLEELENISKKAICLRTFICSGENFENAGDIVNFLPRFGRLRVLILHRYYWQSSPRSLGEDGINMSCLDSSVKHLRYMELNSLPILNLPETMPYLRRLIIRGCWKLTSLPDSIGDLKDLRHLDLEATSLERLPESICGLHSLQHLSLRGCEQLVELPAKMTDLVNLCHLDIRLTRLKSMPSQMRKLIKLQTLTCFVVDKEEGSCIAELGHFRNLGGELVLRDLQNVRDEQDALKAKIKDKSRLEELGYVWEDDDNNSGNVDRSLLQHLEPHVNIRKIHIEGYRGIDFPNWVGDSSFSKIVSLRLDGCKCCTRLPPLGQLASLEVLFIQRFDSLVSVGAEFYGSFNSIQPFRSLRRLAFNEMPKLQQWSGYENETEEDDFTAFPLLESLAINCPQLEMVPVPLSSLIDLSIGGCKRIICWLSDLPKSPSLLYLSIMSVEDIEAFPGMILLPSTLSSILIWNLQNLKSLDYGLHHLTCLTTLMIRDCPNLECIPDEGLPESLTYLSIEHCDLLTERCRKEQGEYWPKIARIQTILIDNEEIQSTE